MEAREWRANIWVLSISKRVPAQMEEKQYLDLAEFL